MIKLITNQTNLFPDDPDIKQGTVKECLDWCDSVSIIEVDTETVAHYLVGGIFTLQLGNADIQWVIDCTTVDVKLFKGPLEDPSKLKILQNAKYDLKYFLYFGIELENIYDTLLAECVLTRKMKIKKSFGKSSGLSLKDLAQNYLQVHLDKEIRGKIYQEGLTKRVIDYAASDVKYLSLIREKQLIRLKKYDLEKTLELENKYVIVLAAKEYKGIKTSIDKLNEFNAFNEKRKLTAQEKINKWIVDNKDIVPEYVEIYQDLFTPPELRARTRIPRKTKSKTKSNYEFIFDSPKKTVTFLKLLGINTKIRDKKTGALKDTSDIKYLAKQKHISSFIPLFIEYKEILKLIVTYGKDFMKHTKIDGRIRSEFWQVLETGRTSSNNPNLQNIPARGDIGKQIRACFIAEEGNTLIINDYSA